MDGDTPLCVNNQKLTRAQKPLCLAVAMVCQKSQPVKQVPLRMAQLLTKEAAPAANNSPSSNEGYASNIHLNGHVLNIAGSWPAWPWL